MNEVKINKQAKSIMFINNGIAFSQFGIANEILDLVDNQQQEIEKLRLENKILNEEVDFDIEQNKKKVHNYEMSVKAILDQSKEIQRLNNKIFLLDSEKEMLRKETIEWEEDCKRAYNIITELEKWLEEQLKMVDATNSRDYEYNTYSLVYSRLKELKGGNRE